MHISSSGLALIQHFEGFSPTPYLCPAGLLTIGYGHVVKPHELSVLRQVDAEHAEQLLKVDATHAEMAVHRSINVPLRQNQFDALVSFTFNLGAGALQRATLRRKINRGEHEAVPRELMRWVWGGGRRLPGLVSRRAAEGMLYQR